MDFFKNTDNSDMILWHGTCADFDAFYPLSQFAVDKNVCDCAEFYEGVRQPQKEYIKSDFMKQHIQQILEEFGEILRLKKTKKIQKHSDFKIIPVHLKMKNPLRLSAWGFDLTYHLIGLVWGLTRNPNENFFKRKSNATCDFIFKDAQKCPYDQVKKELQMGHLFKVGEKEEENRYHLSGQRLILFLEKMGYDGVEYEYMKNSVDAYRKGQIKDFDNRVYVVFRPEQIVRLDKDVQVKSTKPSAREKIELNKIYCRYLQTHLHYKIPEQEMIYRAEWGSVIKNNLHLR